jgi:hypothetical protein
MRHERLSCWIETGPVFDNLSIYALRPAADGIVKGAPSVKGIPFGILPDSNVFVVHAFTLNPGTASRQGPDIVKRLQHANTAGDKGCAVCLSCAWTSATTSSTNAATATSVRTRREKD